MRIDYVRQRISEGSMLPKGYGVAYMDANQLEYVVYPIPFNLIVGWGRSFWYSVVRYRSTMNDRVKRLEDLLDAERKKNWELHDQNNRLREALHAVEVLKMIKQLKED